MIEVPMEVLVPELERRLGAREVEVIALQLALEESESRLRKTEEALELSVKLSGSAKVHAQGEAPQPLSPFSVSPADGVTGE